MTTASQFRELALSQHGAEEGSHQQHADFRAYGKIFAGLTPDGARATLKMTLEAQAVVTSDVDGAFEACAGAWGRSGWTFVRLAEVELDALRELVAEAARLVTPKKRSAAGRGKVEPAAKPSAKKPSAKKPAARGR